LPYTISISSGPSFVSLISSSQIFINPKNLATDLGNHIVQIKLEDQEPKNSIYPIVINVIETSLDTSQPKDQKILMNSIVYQNVPSLSDPLGVPLSVSIDPPML
jgi:hypothetical protein